MSQIAERPAELAPAEDRYPASEPGPGDRSTSGTSAAARLCDWCHRHPDLAALSLVLAVGLLLRLALLYRVPPLFMPGDSQSFLTPAYDLARGLGFDPILKRPLGYPLLLAVIIATLGEDLRSLVFVQAMLGLVTVAATYWVGRLAFGRATGVLAALSVAIGGQLLIYEHYILAESVFAMLLTLSVLALVASATRPSPRAPLSGPADVGGLPLPLARARERDVGVAEVRAAQRTGGEGLPFV